MAKHPKTLVGSIKQKLLKRLLPVRIEFPQENETVVSSFYTFRMVVPEAAVTVDMCIDQGDWMRCRESVGLWWFDWTDFDDGEHEAVCRIRQQDGTVLVSEPRIFFVKRG